MATNTHAFSGTHHDAQDWLTGLARAGYAARGAVYLLVGGLALLAAFNAGGQTTGARGALSTLTDEWWGQAVLFVIGIGLVGYAIWRFLQAHYDLDGHGRDAKGVAVRAGMLISAVTHIVLATWVFTALFGGDGGSGGDSQQRWVAWILDQPGGRVWVTLIGLCVVGAGVAQFVKGYQAKFERHLSETYLKSDYARAVCRVGLVARGIVFCIIGWFFLQAAWTSDASETGGIGEVLSWLQRQPWGWLILALVALGLIAFAIYSFIEAAYRRIHPPDELRATPA